MAQKSAPGNPYVAWMVSNCDHTRGAAVRWEFVQRLIKAGLNIEGFGECFDNVLIDSPWLVFFIIKLYLFEIEISLIFNLTDTGEDLKLVHRPKRPKVDTLFSSIFPTRPSDEYDSATSRKYSRPLLDVFACID